LPPARATVPPSLRESSSRASSLLACYALGPPAFETDAPFELIVRGPGGYEARAAFEGHDEREQGRTDQYRFIFDEPFNWDSSSDRWTVSMRMTATTDGWLPSTMFVLGKVASDSPADWVVMGAHVLWPPYKRFDRKPPPPDDHPEYVISGFEFGG
jgi:hypothetical protein